MTTTKAPVERRHREAALDALHDAPGIVACRTITENEWMNRGGSFLELFSQLYGPPPRDFAHEPQQRFLDCVAQALADAEQRGRDEAAGKWEELLQAARHVINAHSMVWPNKTREQAESEAMRRLIAAVDKFPHPCAAAEPAAPGKTQ